MAIEKLGTTQIRKPDYQEPRWDLPLNENFEAIAAALETLQTGTRWVSGLELVQDGGLAITVQAGIIHRNAVDENIPEASASVQDGTTQFVYLNAGGGLVVANTFEAVDIFPLYMIQASGGLIVSVGDIRHKQVASPGGGGGGLTWVDPQTVDFVMVTGEGYPIDTSGGRVTGTLPADPDPGDAVAIKDYANNFSVIEAKIDPGDDLIEGIPGPMTFTTRGYGGEFTFIDATKGWLITYNTPMDANNAQTTPFLQAEKRLPSGTEAGPLVAGASAKVELTTLPYNTIAGAALQNGNIVLPAGTFTVKFSGAPRPNSTEGALVLTVRRVSDSKLLLSSVTGFADWGTASSVNTYLELAGLITLDQPTEITFGIYTNASCTGTDCMGHALAVADFDEVYNIVQIRQADGVAKLTIADPDYFLKKPLLHIVHQEADATYGGATVAGENLVPLNNIKTNEIAGASLLAGVISLPAGTYFLDAVVPGHVVQSSNYVATLRNADTDDIIIQGSNTRRGATDNTGNQNATAKGRFTLAATTNVKLSFFCTVATATYGLGYDSGVGSVEVYSQLMIWQEDAVVQEPKVFRPVQQPVGGAVVTGNIYGGELVYLDESNVRVKPFSAMSDDLTVGIAVDQNVDLPFTSTPATTYHVWGIRRSNGSMWAAIGTDVSGQDLPGDVTQKRWLGFFRVAGDGTIWQWIQNGDYLNFTKRIDLGVAANTDLWVNTNPWWPDSRKDFITVLGEQNATATNDNVYVKYAIDSVTAGEVVASSRAGATGNNRVVGSFNAGNFFLSASGASATYYAIGGKLKR